MYSDEINNDLHKQTKLSVFVPWNSSDGCFIYAVFASGAIVKLLKVVCSTIISFKLLFMALIIVFTESKSLNKKIYCPPCDSKVNN